MVVVDLKPWPASAPHDISPDALVAGYRYLCRRAARKFWRAGLERCDLEQVAAIGLIKASRRYDPIVRTPFEAYAWMMIVGELMHYVRDHERSIRVPRRLQALERRYLCAHDALVGKFGREPNDSELASDLGIPRATLDELFRARESARFASLTDAETSVETERGGIGFEDRLLVDTSFKALCEMQRLIIVGVYVLGLSQLEMSRRLGISPKRVSRAHHAALGQMHQAWVS